MSDVARLEIFVEELSMEVALRTLVPKIRPGLGFDVHPFNGIDDMLGKLPDRLRGYKHWLPADYRVVIVRDEDRKDCNKLKREIEAMAKAAGLKPKSRRRGDADFQVLTRIVVEELEAWLLGDVPALNATYPRVPLTLSGRRAYRDVDAIAGGTWKALERVLQEAGQFLGGLSKVQVAREVAANMDPERNTSRSFQVFRDGIRAL